MTGLKTAAPIAFVITKDASAARAFYGETLGLTLLANDGFADVYDLAGVRLRITEVAGFEAQPHPVLGWAVPDIVAAVKELGGRGVRFTLYDGMGQDALGIWYAPDGSAKVAFFSDQDGNVLSLTEA